MDKNYFKVSVKDYFCDKCNKYYLWHSKTNKSRKMMIECDEFSRKSNYILLVKYSPKLFLEKKFEIIFIPFKPKGTSYKKKFRFDKLIQSYQGFIVCYPMRKDCLYFSFGRQHF